MQPRKVVFLVNPASDNGATGRRWPQLAHELALAGLSGDTVFSDGPGRLGSLARQAAEDGATLLVVVGGDGSVNEVANGIAERAGVELAVLARGTGWDFVRTYGIPRRPDAAAAVALGGATREIDLGKVTYRTWAGAEATAWFTNVGSAGMSGAIAQRANETTKALGGKVSYAWATLAVFARWHNGEVRVSVDDEIRVGRMQDAIVANGRFFGGGMKICPEALLDNGHLDLVTVGDLGRFEVLAKIHRIFSGTHLSIPEVQSARVRTVEVWPADPAQEVPLEVDGETPGRLPARFEVVPGALKLKF